MEEGEEEEGEEDEPRIGPQTAPTLHTPIAYGTFLGVNRSAIDAPPVARMGEPTKPVRNRKMRMQVKLVGLRMGAWKSVNRKMASQYTTLRPRCGVSCSGERNTVEGGGSGRARARTGFLLLGRLLLDLLNSGMRTYLAQHHIQQ